MPLRPQFERFWIAICARKMTFHLRSLSHQILRIQRDYCMHIDQWTEQSQRQLISIYFPFERFFGSCLVILTDISIKYQVRIWALWYFPRFDETSVCSDQNSKHFSFDIFILCETIQSFDISGLFRENKLSNAHGLNVFVYWMHIGVYTLISPTFY